MRIRTLQAELWLPRPIDEVFAFFADADNLDAITPPWLRFQTLTPRPIVMAAGTRIDHRLRLRGLPVRWQSEITAWERPHRFVDEQRRGPYRRWVHEHTFREQDGGTLVRDRVEYAVPGWFLEPLLNRWLVGPDLRKVFAYRQKRMRELLAPGSTVPEPRIVLL
jgi:ligand-binding SRPBCC domain-containing protein